MNDEQNKLTQESDDRKNTFENVSDDELYEALQAKRRQLHEKVRETWDESEMLVDDPLISLSKDVDEIVNEIYSRKNESHNTQ